MLTLIAVLPEPAMCPCLPCLSVVDAAKPAQLSCCLVGAEGLAILHARQALNNKNVTSVQSISWWTVLLTCCCSLLITALPQSRNLK